MVASNEHKSQLQKTKALRFHSQFLDRLQRLYAWLVGDCRRAPNGCLTEAAALRLVLEEGLRSFEAQAAQETQTKETRK